ncbi:MAG TPA: outer membrane protein assembly factor BamA, partial [Allosphingosinicella sp.]|nr:outer membrane protein assembly factor BamA [Allosphingosinicella sp.]
MLGGLAAPASAQTQQPAAAPQQPTQAAPQPATAQLPEVPAAAPQPTRTIRSLSVTGNQRLEPETVLSYTALRAGEPYDQERLDQALRDLYATELFADVTIAGIETGDIVIQVRENPVINRIVLEGNRRLKDDKIAPEIRLAPRQIFTRSRARADVARIIELYRRQGRYAARVEPQIVQLDQNRVDVVFEINEGPRSQVRQINIIGNESFGDGRLIGEMATRESSWWNIFQSNDTYDPDRLAYDQQALRRFYLTQGYADFRVISAVAELTPDRRDFIITYVVEEGDRYKFGEVNVQSDIRDFNADALRRGLPMHTGEWYNAQQVEDTVTRLNELAGTFGYAFADVRPQFNRSRENLTMSVNFQVAESPRVYVERIDISGNTNTRDKVIRREFRLAEGDPFNSVRVSRSRDRIQSLGYFQENLEISQEQGSGPDRVVLGVAVEERATGQLQFSAGFSSLERFLVNLSIQQRNFRGLGQELRAGINYSSYSKSIELGFTEPYLFDRNIAVGFDIFRRDFNSFNFLGNNRETTYQQTSTGGQLRFGVPLTEHLSLAARYGLAYDQVTLAEALFFTDPDGSGPLPAQCDPFRAGRYLCDVIGNRLTSSIGYSLLYSTLNNAIRPTAGERFLISQDFAGLGGETRYLRTRVSGAKFWNVFNNFVFSLSGEGGYIRSFEEGTATRDPVRLTDRFFLGSPQIRGFDIRGVGPRIQRRQYIVSARNPTTGEPTQFAISDDPETVVDDAIGGRAYYLARAELEIPLGAGARELGLRPSIFADIGALWGVRRPATLDINPLNPLAQTECLATNGTKRLSFNGCATGEVVTRAAIAPFQELFVGNSPSPRLSVGFGVNWNSPFGPF